MEFPIIIYFNPTQIHFYMRNLKNKYSTKVKIVKFTYLYDVGIIFLVLVLFFVAPYFLKFLVSKNFYFAYKYVL